MGVERSDLPNVAPKPVRQFECVRLPKMSKTALRRTKRKTTVDYEATANQLLAEMKRLETLMQADRIEIDRLKAEYHLLREEGVRLQAQTRASLARLEAMFS